MSLAELLASVAEPLAALGIILYPSRAAGREIDELAPDLDESGTDILVVDAVAERVLRAGCPGVEFPDPANLQYGAGVERYRTADGVVDRRVLCLD